MPKGDTVGTRLLEVALVLMQLLLYYASDLE